MKSLEDMQQEHSEMCATAADLGLTLPKDLTVEFDTQKQGAEICGKIDALIKQFRAGLENKDEQKVVAGPEIGAKPAAAPRKKPLADRGGKEQPAPAKTKASKSPDEKSAAQPEKENTVKAPKKAAKKSAKKAVAKKAAKKGAVGTPRTKFDENAKITWIGSGKDGANPCREGSARHDRYEKLRKGSGKTVKAVLASGVPSATLINASAAKVIKIA